MLAIAALLDYWIGDPWNWLHPVQIMGWSIKACVQVSLSLSQNPFVQRICGMITGVLVISISALVGWLVIWGCQQIHPWLSLVSSSILVASCFAGRSLRHAANDVLEPLHVNDLETAQIYLSRYVGRDTAMLDRPEILRAVLETVSENATDGVMAPLFYAILGATLPIGSAPLVLAYKAASTLDSMIGYRRAPYTYIGWFSARVEDGLTWLPCRLTVLTIALLSGRPFWVLRICKRDAPKDPSPNAGWSECAYAAALGVQMGGTNWYHGTAKYKPLLGEAIAPIAENHIHRAMQLTRLSILIWLGVTVLAFSIQWQGLGLRI
jgi:adenosylcobinamide-phosphate synthase